MALIICPNCGKQVSSTAECCVHCGFGLDKPVEACEYKSLNSGEKDALQEEFYALNPEFTEYEKEAEENTNCFNRYSRVLRIMIFVCLAVILGCIWAAVSLIANSENLSASFSENPALYLPLIAIALSLVCFFGILIVGIVSLFLLRRLNKRIAINGMIVITRFKVWLKEAKNIDYEITGIKDKYVDYIRDFEYEGVDKFELKRR